MVSDTQTKICAQIKPLINLLNNYNWLSNNYMLHFYTDNIFGKLPRSWKDLMATMKIEEYGALLNSNERHREVWPLSLLAVRSILKHYTLLRQDDSKSYTCNDFNLNDRKVPKMPWFEQDQMKYLFTKNVKPKKRYEIDKMAEKTARIANEIGVQCVVDIGSGVGHLCRRLGYIYGLKVVGVEVQEELCKRARQLDENLELTASKRLSPEIISGMRNCRPYHTNYKISEDGTFQMFIEIIEKCIGSSENIGIIGLHPCGDLGPNLLKMFLTCDRIKFISVVGCCYDKLSLNCNSSGFPMSQFMIKEEFTLSMASAALACHANEASYKKLTSGDYDYLKIHCYRATLEAIICKSCPEFANCGVGNVKHYPQLTFPEYCEKALNKLNIKISDEDLNSVETINNLDRWKDALFYHVIWLMFAPAIETIIQLDRLLYLAENGVPCELQACFDPLLSPRNNILSAIKPM